MGRYLNLEMLRFSILIIFSSSSFIMVTSSRTSQGRDECYLKQTNCRKHGGPEIRFPFWVTNNSNPNRCGYPGFGLSCTGQGETLLQSALPVTLLVEGIDYVSQSIYVRVGGDCLLRQLQDLNLSSSPFQLDDRLNTNYTFFNCSPSADRDGGGVVPIPCSSVRSGYQVYSIRSDYDIEELPLSYCEKTASFALSSHADFFLPYKLALQWSHPNCGECEREGKRCRLKNSTEPAVECYRPPHNTKGAIQKLKTAGYVLGSFLLALLAIGCYHLYSADQMEKENQAKIEKFLEDYRALKPTRYSYADIKRITHQFKDKLGQGGFGTVFKGKLSNEIFVAVKILNTAKGDGEEFINEVGTMGRIHHINVVRLVGFCADGFRRALVYDFLPNESLEKFILSESIKKALGWKKLKDIALGIAKGIEYLHQGCDQRILHFDIKPHNILLDHNFDPKVSDFGLAKLCSKEQSAVSMTAARGTIGYIAPEVFSRNFGSVSHKSDVYSFGMLLLDMAEGRRNIEDDKENSSQCYFPNWIYGRMERGEVIGSAIDTVKDANIAKQLTIVGLWCIQWYPIDRPSMKDVVKMLEGEGESLTMPPNPFSSTNPTKASTGRRGRDLNNELPIISESEFD